MTPRKSALALSALLATVACVLFYAAIWIGGELGGRLTGSGFLTLGIAVVLGFVADMFMEVDD